MKESGPNESQLSSPVRWGAVVLLVVGVAVLAWLAVRAWNFSRPGRVGGPSPLAPREAVEPPRPATELDPSLPQGWTAQTKRVTVITPEGEKTKEIVYYTNTIGMEFVLVPAGEFMMGSPASEEDRDSDEGPVHRVRITKPFYMGACEVTQAQWEAVMGNNPSYYKGRDNPVEKVSWNACQEFVEKLSSKEGLQYRLPTEAEWEYACRAGSTTPFHTGETISTDQANYDGNYTYGSGRKGVYRQKTTPVGSFPANAFGLFDMSGNVWEWCQDWFDSKYYAKSPAMDPNGPESGGNRVLRGGSWLDFPGFCRSADRYSNGPTSTDDHLGFRVVVPSPEE